LSVTCKAGDVVLVESPTYYGLLQVIEHLGLRVLEVPNHAESGIDVDAVRSAVRTTRLGAALLVPNFNNPVGSRTPDDAKREIVRTLTERGVPIIEDDVTGDLPLSGERPRPLYAFDDSGLVITCGSASKTVALGFRVGWAISGGFSRQLKRAKFFSSVAAPTLPQLVLARYLASGGYDRHVRRIRQQLASNVQLFLESMAKHFPPGTRVARPAGGSLLWAELPPQVDGTEVFRAALAKGVGVMPGAIFSATGRFRNYIRLNCGVEWTQRVASAMEKLGRIVEARCR
jgi:DNA-binding transcriptional MocR family regulator